MLELHPKLRDQMAKHPLIAGSFLLTLAGFLSRLIGFFYRMYLSQIFGEEGMGIYQLLGPVMALSFSLTAAGFQTAISKFVAENCKNSTQSTIRPFLLGLSTSLPASIILMFFIMHQTEWIATCFLQEPRTASMLRILALSLPLSAVHACINGYFYGLKQASIPALCQLVEQTCRVLSVYLFTSIGFAHGHTPTLNVTVMGLVMGEIASTILCILALLHHLHSREQNLPHSEFSVTNHTSSNITYGMLLSMVLPLIANRISLNLLQSIETVSIPARLRLFGYDSATSLSVYGVLTGMAFPLLFFPNAITSAFAVLLLPLISEKSASGDKAGVKKLTLKTITYCSILGFSCMLIFFVFGEQLGIVFFHSQLAGLFIRTLSFICPFLYLNNTLSAILQGMGKVLPLFFINVTALSLRLLFILFLIPIHGIKAYLWGLLISQLFQSTAYLFSINHFQRK